MGRLADGSQPSLARRVRKAPAMVVGRLLFVGTSVPTEPSTELFDPELNRVTG